MENAAVAVPASVLKDLEQVAHAASRVTATTSTVGALSNSSRTATFEPQVSTIQTIRLGDTSQKDWKVLSPQLKAQVLKELAPKIKLLLAERNTSRNEQLAIEQARQILAKRLRSAESAHRWYDNAFALFSEKCKARFDELRSVKAESIRAAMRHEILGQRVEESTKSIGALFAEFRISQDPYSSRIAVEREKREKLIVQAQKCADLALQAVESVGTFVSQEALGKTLQLMNETLHQSVSFIRSVALTESQIAQLPDRVTQQYEIPMPLVQALGDLAHAQRAGWRSAASISQSVLATLSKVDIYFRDLVQQELQKSVDLLKSVDVARRDLISIAVRAAL